jgi:MSHA pilin protein MshA
MKKRVRSDRVELFAAIIVIGILCIIAIPRFLVVHNDALSSAVQLLNANLKASVDQVYAKSVIHGLEKSANVTGRNPIFLEGIEITYGTPTINADGIGKMPITADHFEMKIFDGISYFIIKGSNDKLHEEGVPSRCFVKYQPRQSADLSRSYTLSYNDDCSE